MGVEIDQTGCDELAVDVDYPLSVTWLEIWSNRGDRAIQDGDGRFAASVGFRVDDGPAVEEEIILEVRVRSFRCSCSSPLRAESIRSWAAYRSFAFSSRAVVGQWITCP